MMDVYHDRDQTTEMPTVLDQYAAHMARAVSMMIEDFMSENPGVTPVVSYEWSNTTTLTVKVIGIHE